MVPTLVLSLFLAVGQTEPAPAISSQPADEKKNSNGDDAPKPDERWFLMKALDSTHFGSGLESHKIQISGWTHMSFTASSAAHEQLPMGFNYRANDFLLQQNWVRIERSVDTDAKTASFGFRSDTILPGSDYRFTVARGLFDGQLRNNNGNPVLYGFDPIQFYAEAYFPNVCSGLDIKIGRTFCQFGIESNDAPSNALLSHAYTFIYNPFTHTGIFGTLKLSDTWSIQSGIVLGCDVFIDPASSPYYMGSIKWAPKDGDDSVLFSVLLGSGRFNVAESFHNPQVFDLVYTHKFHPKLKYSLEALYGFTTNVPDIGTAHWLGVINYLTRDFTDKVSATARLELFDDFQGQRTGFRGLYTGVTAGVSWTPTRAIVMRPELRYDVNSESRPFENRRGLFTAATDVIIRW